MASYHEDHRPDRFDDVIGNTTQVDTLVDVLRAGTSNAFLFVGPAGTGKTTLARLAAQWLNAQVISIDAASNSGVEAMREVVETARYTIGGQGRAFIVDECHRLSAQAWDTMLTVTEEPHKKLYWLFCTTDPKKVPTTIKTRCVVVDLQPLRFKEVKAVLNNVVKRAKLDVSDEVLEIIADNSGGSARQALTHLAKVEKLSPQQAAAALVGAEASKGVIDLARFIMDGRGSWSEAMDIVTDLKDESYEGVRIVISNYLGKVLRSAKKDQDAMRMLGILQHWVVPYAVNEGITPLMVSIGRSLFTVKE